MGNNINRRSFLKMMGIGTATTAVALTGCKGKVQEEDIQDDYSKQIEPPTDKMTYRTTPTTGDKVSILGYGMMRLPTIANGSARTSDNPKADEIDQEQVNKLVKYALDHGVNYFDTSPAYCRGKSEESTGIALKASGYDRSKYFIATKLSNFDPSTWTYQASVEMFQNSLKYLQTDHIDYLLLHSVGGGGMENLHKRYLDNGVLDYLMQQREKGVIRNLGFSYHGDIEVFDWLLEQNDKYHWDFVQIELNYLEWQHAHDINENNTNSIYLYEQLQKQGIPSVIMEPLLGGRLAQLPQFLVREMKQRAPESSVASWAFRFAGHHEGILTVLSGMTYMEHLKDNLLTYSPLKPLSDEELEFLEHVSQEIVNVESIPCTNCKYCMPCPYGIDIPTIFAHYNKCKNEGTLPANKQNEKYRELRRNYLIGLDRSVPKLRQANHCISCGQCVEHCPQRIRIPHELHKIDQFVEELKRDGFTMPERAE